MLVRDLLAIDELFGDFNLQPVPRYLPVHILMLECGDIIFDCYLHLIACCMCNKMHVFLKVIFVYVINA